MIPSTGPVIDRIAVIGASGEHMEWVTESEAHDAVKAGTATCVWRRGKLRTIMALEGFRARRIEATGRGTGLDHTRYSSTRESETNPPRVWAFLRLGEGLVPMRG